MGNRNERSRLISDYSNYTKQNKLKTNKEFEIKQKNKLLLSIESSEDTLKTIKKEKKNINKKLNEIKNEKEKITSNTNKSNSVFNLGELKQDFLTYYTTCIELLRNITEIISNNEKKKTFIIFIDMI